MKRLLVVGCGSIGRRHAENAGRMAEAAVYDLDPGVAVRTATDFGLRSFPSLAEGLSWGPDGVIVATPNHTHIEIARLAVTAGADVLVEKPISHDPSGVDDFLKEADKSGRQVFVVCNMRFHPAVATIHNHLEEIGRPYFARAHYGNYLPDMRPGSDYRSLYCANRTMGGGVVLDASHEIDYLMWFFGPVAAVLCEAEKLSDLDIDVEDCASLILRHQSGVRSEIHLDYLQRFKRRGLEIVGSEGTIVWLSEGKKAEVCEVKMYTASTEGWKTLVAEESLDTTQMYGTVIAQFLKAMGGEEVSLLTGRHGASVLAVALAARQAAETGRQVYIK